jgi:WG containing repeat
MGTNSFEVSQCPGYRRKVSLLLFSVSNEGMKRRTLFVLLMGLCSFAVGQDDLRSAYRDGLYGYIDGSGSWVVEPRFTEASGWEDGAAKVGLANGDFAFIDSNGKYLMRPRRFQRLGDLREGLAVFELEGGKYDTYGFLKNVGFIDVTGQVVIAPHFVAAYDFSEGVAAASVEFFKCGYIDKQGHFVIEPVFESGYQLCGPFSEGLAHVEKGGKFGYIDHTGSFVIRPTYDYAYDFSEGYAVVGMGSRYVFIDKRGAVLGTSSYGFARAFSGGLAPVAPNDKWGFIDKSGALAIPTKYEEVGDFSEGLAWVQINGKCGYINMRGDLVVPPKYDRASDFWNGMAEVVQNPTPEGDPEVRTIIDTAGTPVLLGKR